ncbi:hypothetical protein [Leeuwenhoekiella sp. W20_SRS_FM14]|uniref:hypothetical protein n=1 Tax=Leeuwenhoekiella sp. W20_SRS_FM14 TaxID=3240270 RepID=UPI003F960C3B
MTQPATFTTLILFSLFSSFSGNGQQLTEAEYAEKGKYIWEHYVPQSGQAKFVQGELLRAIEKLRDEAQRNGNGNFNNQCHGLLVDYLRSKLTDPTLFSEEKIQGINAELDLLNNAQAPYTHDAPYDYITNRIIDWYLHYGETLEHNPNPNLNC